MKIFFFILLLGVRSQELPTPSSLLYPRNFNHHAYQYLEDAVEPTKQGPVLFPNDAPPPPKPPLIVTSRPLSESIARSELNDNNTITASSQIKPEFRLKPDYLKTLKPLFRLKPEYRTKPQFLARVKDYTPFFLSTPATEDFGPYHEVKGLGDSKYGDYEEHTALPPIYKAFADHARQQKTQELKHYSTPSPHHYDYQVTEPAVSQRYQHKDVRDKGDEDYDNGSNYAFSYRVKDHKTGDDFSHSQHSSGSATNGEYRVRLPDGRMQIVSYTADENGYKADVRYDDEDKVIGNTIDHKYDYKNNYDYDSRHNNLDHTYNYDYPVSNRDYTANIHDYSPNNRDHTSNNHDYTTNNQNYKVTNQNYVQNRDFKIVTSTKSPPVKEDFNQYSDLSKEYYNTDYSLEYDGKDDNYEPHKSKFSSFKPKGSNLGTIVVPHVNQNSVSSSTVRPSYEELKPLFVTKNLYPTENYLINQNSVSSSTVRPSYEELKPLFVTKNLYPTQNYLKDVEINVPSTTPSSLNYDGTTEHVVIIGTPKANLYTNIRNQPLTDIPPVTPGISNNFVTPSSYLVSTIANLKNGQKPVLSNSFIDRINKYLTFT